MSDIPNVIKDSTPTTIRCRCCEKDFTKRADEGVSQCYECYQIEDSAGELAKWLNEKHKTLGPYIWEECCRVYGFGGTPEATRAYKKIAIAIKEALTQPNH